MKDFPMTKYRGYSFLILDLKIANYPVAIRWKPWKKRWLLLAHFFAEKNRKWARGSGIRRSLYLPYWGLELTFSRVDLSLERVSRDHFRDNGKIAIKRKDKAMDAVNLAPRVSREREQERAWERGCGCAPAKLWQWKEVLEMTLIAKRLMEAPSYGLLSVVWTYFWSESTSMKNCKH